MTDLDRRNKLRLNKLEKAMSSMRRTRPQADSPRSMAVMRHGPSNLNDNRDVVDALLPIVPDKPRKHMKREFMLEPPRIACSLDFLAAIANEQARYDLDNAYGSSESTNETDHDNVFNDEHELEHELEHENDEDDEEDTSESDEDEYESHSTSSGETSADTCDEYHTSPEEDAAAVLQRLLMTSIVQHYQGPRKRRRTDASAFEGRSLRSRRLSQNQLYRKRLHDKGVYPICQGPQQYACSLCFEVFVKEMFVWRHGAKHLESKPFQCALCGGKFNRSDSLQRHVRNFHRKK